jgi:ribosomal-protein-alanine N-acetyltransferase
MTQTYRFLTCEDCPQMVQLYAEAFSKPWTLDMMHRSLESPHKWGWGLALNGTLISFILVQQIKEDAEIVTFVVGKAFQGQGFGKKILKTFLQQATSRGIQNLYLDVHESNLNARHLYESVGFKKIGKRRGYYFVSHNKPGDAVLYKMHL